MERKMGKGRPIQVFVNMLSLQFSQKSADVVLHYDVAFDDKTPKGQYRGILDKILRENFKGTYPAFDGRKNMYSAKKLFKEEEVNLISQIL